MPNCPKCGAKVTEGMNFCANCGTNLKPTPPPVQEVAPTPSPPPRVRYEKHEKQEKGEKREKAEKGEKHEKREYGYMSPVIVGIILIVLGVFFYLMMTIRVPTQTVWAYFFIVIGIAIVLAAVYAATMATRRHPPA